MGVLSRWSRYERQRRAIGKAEEAFLKKSQGEKFLSIKKEEEALWEKFRVAQDKSAAITRTGVSTLECLPSVLLDGTEMTEEALEVCVGVTNGMKLAVGRYGAGVLTDAEIKRVILSGFRILGELASWDRALRYTPFLMQMLDDAVNSAREVGLGEVADRYQRAQELTVRLHQQFGHELIG
ncbi:hypothetical protein [Streptomyces sp. 900116325]